MMRLAGLSTLVQVIMYRHLLSKTASEKTIGATNNHTSKKLEILEINLRQFFGFSANFFAENAEPFKFALCLETALPIFSKLCSNIA